MPPKLWPCPCRSHRQCSSPADERAEDTHGDGPLVMRQVDRLLHNLPVVGRLLRFEVRLKRAGVGRAADAGPEVEDLLDCERKPGGSGKSSFC